VLDYARSFGVPASVLRMSCIYGQRQMGTEDQGWVAHFLIRAIEGEPITLYGDGHQVRDILDVSNAVEAYMQAWARIGQVSGRAFNLGGGPSNAVSLRELLGFMGELLGREVDVRFSDWRAGDQRYFVADTRAARAALGLSPAVPWKQGVARLADWLRQARGLTAAPVPERAAS
jgi:CDP-paratose 2-epimerase